MAGNLDQWSPEAWERARKVLLGESDEGVSLRAAARAAGVETRQLEDWIIRSRERRPEDDNVIHSMAQVADQATKHQAYRLEDVAWKRAVKGTPKPLSVGGEIREVHQPDNKLLEKMLGTRDERYREQQAPQQKLEISVLFQRVQAIMRLRDAEIEEMAEDAEFTEVPRQKPPALTSPE